MDALISAATRRNWDRLNVTGNYTKLTKRANKTNSKKSILPVEYFSNGANQVNIEELIRLIRNADFDIFDVMYSIVINCFNALGVISTTSPHKLNVQQFLDEYKSHTCIPQLIGYKLPTDEADVPGLVYQSLRLEGARSRQGLYYTPANIVKSIVARLDFTKGQNYLDPCCGSGSYLINLSDVHPSRLFGVDCDPIAVMLCKANLIIRFRDIEFTPQVFCFDFLGDSSVFDSQEIMDLRNRTFDYVFTNPPWGAVARSISSCRALSGDLFSCFLFKALELLREGGILNFLLPEAVLNVRTHCKLREHLIDKYSLERIRVFPNLFTGVTTKFVSLEVANATSNPLVTVDNGTEKYAVSSMTFKQSNNCVFSLVNSQDEEILKSIYAQGGNTLSNSTWALGIVTGNNSGKLFDSPVENGEPIYTGKEIRPYRLMPPKKYVVYDRSQFQQVAKDEIYRAKEKLVYKFISNKLVFAYDDSKSLFLNSANILIPTISNMSIKTVLLFLNSELFQFAYIKRFGEIKILKGNLCELPFPKLSIEDDLKAQKITDRILAGNSLALDAAQKFVYSYYGIIDNQMDHIRKILSNGTFA